MPEKADYLIVGAGLSGAIMAQELASDPRRKIIVIDRRPHIAGNCHDYYDKHGILVHAYGPHAFHTSDAEVWQYLNRFSKWRRYPHMVEACIRGKYYPLPINIGTLSKYFGVKLNRRTAPAFVEKLRVPDADTSNSEGIMLSLVGREIYEAFFKYYTRKQWGRWPSEMDASVCARIPIRFNYDARYSADTYLGIPTRGYDVLVQNLLDRQNIEVRLSTEFETARREIPHKKLIYTGQLDAYYGYRFGHLPYRSLRFKFETHRGFYQNTAQVNYPAALRPAYTRIIEFKRMTGQKHPLTTISKEYPSATGEPLYPVLTPETRALYARYRKLADREKNVYFLGRLAQYHYCDMWLACRNALDLAKKLA